MSYNLLKFLHVASVAIWVGGMITMLVLNRMFQSDPAGMQALGKVGARLGMRVFLPAVLLTIITGVGAAQVGGLDFGSTWLIWGIAGAIGSIVVGGILTGGAARRLSQRIARGEIDAAGVAAAQRRIFMFSVLNVVVLISVVWAMVYKPV